MIYRARVSFAGTGISMARGTEAELDEKAAAPLVECGYLEPAEQTKSKGRRRGGEPPPETEEKAR